MKATNTEILFCVQVDRHSPLADGDHAEGMRVVRYGAIAMRVASVLGMNGPLAQPILLTH